MLSPPLQVLIVLDSDPRSANAGVSSYRSPGLQAWSSSRSPDLEFLQVSRSGVPPGLQAWSSSRSAGLEFLQVCRLGVPPGLQVWSSSRSPGLEFLQVCRPGVPPGLQAWSSSRSPGLHCTACPGLVHHVLHLHDLHPAGATRGGVHRVRAAPRLHPGLLTSLSGG